jgi:general secretion pathway protein F
MPAYRYEAADAAGRADRGVIEADSPAGARAASRTRADADHR